MLSDGHGGFVHLTRAVAGWLRVGANPFGLYLYRKDVDALAAIFAGEIRSLKGPAISLGDYDSRSMGPTTR